MNYDSTECEICKQVIRYGPSVVYAVENGEPTGYAHADCWVSSGREIFWPGMVAEWQEAMTDPRQTVLIERGHGLDAIGVRPEIDLPRNGIETDHDYRNRLIERMRGADVQRKG